ncbi:SMC-Scp complex subunit ScpB [Candidatus Uhrbacteria bacterium]|nr:SMC-Scp complex subunit ScpB [Candidatus Uhrbacteria bacterium]
MIVPAQIEALLFAAGKPLSEKKIAAMLACTPDDVRGALGRLWDEYNTAKRGIRLLKNGAEYQMATAPEYTKLVQGLVREDEHGDLTRPQLESLTIIAYRGPITKAALEQIRGVHSGLIIRNLLIRGLIEATEDVEKLQITYCVSFDFLRWLGIHDVEELPEYKTLHDDPRIESVLAMIPQ